MLQLAPAATEAFWQSSVSLKSPLRLMAVSVNARLPVLVTFTLAAPLAAPTDVPAKVTAAGLTSAVVKPVLAVHSEDCHTPLP